MLTCAPDPHTIHAVMNGEIQPSPYATLEAAKEDRYGFNEPPLSPAVEHEREGPVIIGLYSPMSHMGKSTLAKLVADKISCSEGVMSTDIRPFAGPLRAICSLALSRVGVRNPHKAMTEGKDRPLDVLDGKTPRQLMIDIGTHGLRAVSNNYFIKALAHDIAFNPFPFIIVDDVRFANEAWWVVSRRGILVRVEREVDQADGQTKQYEGQLEQMRGLFQFDIVNPTMADLDIWARRIAAEAISRRYGGQPRH